MTLTTEVLVEQIAQYLITHPEQTGTFLVGLLGAFGSYRKTGNIPLGRIPYRHLRRMIRDIGDTYFGTSRPRSVPALIADAPPEEVEAALRDDRYESGDLYSYEYGGEVWNLRRPAGMAMNPKTERQIPMEVHPRGFLTDDDRTLILSHREANRWEATKAHIDETVMSWSDGRDAVLADLSDVDFEITEIDSEADAGIEVVE